jgi:hypothetical protein
MAKKPKKRAEYGEGSLRRRKRPDGTEYGKYGAQKRVNGKMVSKSFGTEDYREAKKLHRAWLAALESGDNSEADGRILVINYLKNWYLEKKDDVEKNDTMRDLL